MTIDILDSAGRVVRTYSSADPVRHPDPALDSAAYNRLCQQTPTARDCGLPLYWPAPPTIVSTEPGMHRLSWDLHFAPIPGDSDGPAGGDAAVGAVPHRTLPLVNAPWAPRGRYTVRLTVDGKRMTQPLVLRLDPRVKTSAAGLAQLASLSQAMYDGALAAHARFLQARALIGKLDGAAGEGVATFRAAVDSVAPVPVRRQPGFGFGPPAPPGPPTLTSTSAAMMAAAMAMQGADVAPTAREIAACDKARGDYQTALARWTALETKGLAAFNAKRKAAGQAEVRGD